MGGRENERFEDFLSRVLEVPTDEQRDFIENNCDDPALRKRMIELLAQEAERSQFLEQPAVLAYETVAQEKKQQIQNPIPSWNLPSTVGPFRIRELLGEGGMGVVYLAEQCEPVQRQLAVKVVRADLTADGVRERFDAERQALARLSHPYIAQIYEAGATDQGFPYFAMELISGEPITGYCDRKLMSIEERLKLFIQVCQGVQHAHQRGIIHRDLKPSNILVTEVEGRPVPKLIDFGIAKAVERPLTDVSHLTGLSAVGTPAYMSPESLGAIDGSPDVDTRTDVYALGILLFELLVGVRPFESHRSNMAQVMVRIATEDAPRPSTRFSSLAQEDKEEVADQRQVSSSLLQRHMAGDLDWIAGKAIRRNREERYDSATELAADLGRHLDDRPVEASPPSVTYLAKKFVKRHRGGVAAAAAGLLILIAFAVMMTVQAGRIAAEAEAKGLVSEFLKDLFSVSDPGEARGNSITARELLDKGAEKIEGTLEDQPEIRAELMDTMGDVYRRLGLYPAAEPLLKQALAERKRVLGKNNMQTIASMVKLANVYLNQGRYEDAEPLYLEAVDKRKHTLGEDHPDTLSSINNLAALYWSQGRFAEAEPLFVEILEIRRRMLGNDGKQTINSMNNLAIVYWNQGRISDAEPLYVEALEARKRVLGDDHPDTLSSMNNLAVLYQGQNRYVDAEPLLLEALGIQRRVLGDEHPNTLSCKANLAILYQKQGHYADALPLYVEALEKRKQAIGSDHPHTLETMNGLAILYGELGRYAEAEPLFLEALEARKQVLGDEHQDTLTSGNNLGGLLVSQGRYEEARLLLERTHQARLRVLGDTHSDVGYSHYNLACLASALGKRAKALEHLRKAASLGWAERTILTDSSLDILRGTPEFEALVAEVQKKIDGVASQ